MRVFKACFRIIWKNLPTLAIYLAIFLFFALILSFSGASNQPEHYADKKSRIMIINEDEGGEVADGLVQFLSGECQIVTPEKEKVAQLDSLFSEDAEYILSIPSGFTDDFLSGKHSLTIGKMIVPNSTTGVQVDLLVQKYLDTFRLYAETGRVTSDDTAALETIRKNIREDLDHSTDIVWAGAAQTGSVQTAAYYFKYLSYTILSVMILGVSTIMRVFNKPDLRRRMLGSPLAATRVNLELFLGMLCYAVAVWAVMMAISLVFVGPAVADQRIVLMILNALVLTVTALSLSFLCAQFIRGPGSQHSVANVIALGTSFVSGVFVPQSLLGDTVKNVASFTPTYWYVTAVEDISTLSSFGLQNTRDIYLAMLIQMAFAAAFLVVALGLGRQKRRKSN